MQDRRATEADIPQLQALFERAIRFACTTDYSPEQIDIWAATAQNQERWTGLLRDQLVFVLEKGDTIAAFASLKENNYMDFLYVAPEFKGQGLSRRIVKLIEDAARKAGSSELLSDISITAKPAMLKMGWEVIRENQNQRGGEVLINYRMRQTW